MHCCQIIASGVSGRGVVAPGAGTAATVAGTVRSAASSCPARDGGRPPSDLTSLEWMSSR